VLQAAARLKLIVVRHATPAGRGGAANAGAAAARGDVLLFLDGDTLAGPDLVARHAALHAAAPRRVGRGATWHVRATRWLYDPQAGTPFPDHADRLAGLPAAEIARMCVTSAQIQTDFAAAVHGRAQPGVYAGVGPRRLYELEMDALTRHPDCAVLWAAASGSNLSVARADFERAGGFHAGIDSSEHRELALRLCAQGCRMAPVPDAFSYHLLHRVGWRDPLADTGWLDVFAAAHPLPEVRLLPRFWAGLADGERVPAGERIASLPALAAAARA